MRVRQAGRRAGRPTKVSTVFKLPRGWQGPNPMLPPQAPETADQAAAQRERYTEWQKQYAGSFAQFVAFEWLRDEKNLRPNQDFLFNRPFFGGPNSVFKADFLIPKRGLLWHIRAGSTTGGLNALLLSAEAQAKGYSYAGLNESILLSTPESVLTRAWQGVGNL